MYERSVDLSSDQVAIVLLITPWNSKKNLFYVL